MKKHINTGYQILFSLFCGVIPFTDLGEAVPNIVLIGITLLFPFVVKKEDWKKIQKLSLYILFFLVFVITIQLSFTARWEDLEFIGRLVLVAVVIIYSIPVKNKFFPMLSFVLGSLLLIFFSSIKLTLFFLDKGIIDMTTGEQIASVLLGDRPYVAYVYVLSFCLCMYLSTQFLRKKFLLYVIAFLFFIFILFISARVSLISLGLIALSYMFYSKNLKKTGTIVFVLFFLCVLMFTFNDSLKKRFFISKNTYPLEQVMKFEPRYYIWSCGYQVFIKKNSCFLGQGFVNTNNQLKACYSDRTDFMNEKHQEYFVRSGFNTHNQFLNFILSTGVFVFLLFVLFFIVWFIIDYKNYYVFILLLAMLLFCLAENVLSRQMGVELFALTWIFSNMISFNYVKQD